MKMEKTEFVNKTGFIGPYEKGKGKKGNFFQNSLLNKVQKNSIYLKKLSIYILHNI